jgi:hypothetical protein
VQERDEKLSINKTLKRPVIDLKLEPNWSTEFCPFPSELCNCREQGSTKIGHWDRREDGTMFYTPRPGIDQPDHPTQAHPAMVADLVKAQRAKEAT